LGSTVIKNYPYRGIIFEKDFSLSTVDTNFIEENIILGGYPELLKLDTEIYHYHTSDKKEIDFILSRGDDLLAIEVKASHSADKGDFKHIFDFQTASKKNVIGIVFYMGEYVIEIDEQNFAVPFGMFF